MTIQEYLKKQGFNSEDQYMLSALELADVVQAYGKIKSAEDNKELIDQIIKDITLVKADYERRLVNVTQLIEDIDNNGSVIHIQRAARLTTKAYEFKLIIAEFQKLIQKHSS